MGERQSVDSIFGAVLTMIGREVPDEPTTFAIGASPRLVQAIRHPGRRGEIIVVGARRFGIVPSHWRDGILRGNRWIASPKMPPFDRSRSDWLSTLRRCSTVPSTT